MTKALLCRTCGSSVSFSKAIKSKKHLYCSFMCYHESIPRFNLDGLQEPRTDSEIEEADRMIAERKEELKNKTLGHLIPSDDSPETERNLRAKVSPRGAGSYGTPTLDSRSQYPVEYMKFRSRGSVDRGTY